MQRTFLLPVALTVLAITQNRGQTRMHLAPCPNAAGDGEIRRGPVPGRRTRVSADYLQRPKGGPQWMIASPGAIMWAQAQIMWAGDTRQNQ